MFSDPAGIQYSAVYLKMLSDGSWAVCFTNYSDVPVNLSLVFWDAGFPCNTGYGLKFRDLWAQEDAGVYRDTFCCMSCCPARPACLPGDGCKAVRWLSAKTAEESFLQMSSQLQSGSLTAAPPSFCALTASQSIFGAVAGLFWTGSVIIRQWAAPCSVAAKRHHLQKSKKIGRRLLFCGRKKN